jgi:prepilin-type N-terminal cleavage/methylation domain-containing protein
MGYLFKIKNGFTLIELIVVIAIIGFFSSFLLINFRSNQKVAEVRQQALLVIDLIKQTQTMALSGQLVDGARPVGYGAAGVCVSSDKPCWKLIVTTMDGESWDIVSQSELSKNVKLVGDVHLFSFSGTRANLEITAFQSSGEVVVQDAVLRIENIDDASIAQCVGANALSGRIDLIDCPS